MTGETADTRLHLWQYTREHATHSHGPPSEEWLGAAGAEQWYRPLTCPAQLTCDSTINIDLKGWLISVESVVWGTVTEPEPALANKLNIQ